MKSFPSTMDAGGSRLQMQYASTSLLKQVVKSFKDAFKQAWNAGVTAALWGATNQNRTLKLDGLLIGARQDKKDLLKKLAISNRNATWFTSKQINNDKHHSYIENPYHFDAHTQMLMNQYMFNIGTTENVGGIPDKEHKQYMTKVEVAPSLFNPYYGVHVCGIVENLPLLGNVDDGNKAKDNIDLNDCRISRLVELSREKNGFLGQARYKFADFAFCKDLGMPNNHLITLRRFAIPVGDNIFRMASNNDSPFAMTGDIGRMLCYFGTEDNKLEDILKYNYNATWRKMDSEIQQINSKEDDRSSPLGRLLNTMNPQYNKMQGEGRTGSNNLITWGLQEVGVTDQSWYEGDAVFGNYDKHKVYEPKDTIQSMYKYEGKLEFKHEFTLTFRYVLRGYDNINPKSAMLDLIGNVLTTTYRKGNFWGGRKEILGAQPNSTGWKMAKDLEDGFETAMGNVMTGLADGTMNLSSILGSIANYSKDMWNQFSQKMQSFTMKDLMQGMKNINDATGLTKGFMGVIKNSLGRPQIYAFNSLLKGDNTGLWHVTIGNPINPIMSMGNLIMTDCQVQHCGPLGMDDFPTELKVTVTLAHARGRDSIDIQKMYTKGQSGIYNQLLKHDQSNAFFTKSKGEEGTPDLKGKDGDPNLYEYVGDFNTDRIKRNIDELS